MSVKIYTTLCLVTIAMMMSAVEPLSAQSKIGLVDVQTALLATAEMQVAADQLEAEFSDQQKALAALAAEITAVQQKLAAAPDQQSQATLEAQMPPLQRRFERDRQDLQAAIDFRRNGVLEKGATKMRDVLEALRVKKGFDLIIDSTTIYVFDPALNVTVEATNDYDAAHPVAAN
jgi:Skp family chaperone for outer membrane proteins